MSRRYSFSVVAVVAFVLILVGQSGAVAAPRSIVNDNPVGIVSAYFKAPDFDE
jgi:hypothetical protein